MTIKTKLHILAENIATSEAHGVLRGDQHPVIAKMLAAASFVVDSDVVELLRQDATAKSIQALMEAGIARLPYPSLCIEFETGPIHDICYFEEMDNAGIKIRCGYGSVDKRTNVCVVSDNYLELELSNADKSLRIHGMPENPQIKQIFVTGIQVGMMIALLMLNTMGIEKRVVEVKALNKARAKHGKPAIPRHTIVHIGTIYRRDGTGMRYGSHEARHVRMHLRSAYTRRQHYGKGREETKIVFIPACIVNFRPDEELRQPKKVLKV